MPKIIDMPTNTPEEPKTDPLLQFFNHGHLPTRQAQVAAPFAVIAHELVKALPRNPERTVALRKLIESRDSALRALVYVEVR